MRKIYSLVLMAAMLLLGTNSWAVNVQVSGSEGTAAELQAAIDAAASGTTLTLQHDFTLTEPVWLGTTEYNGDYKSITLDLNGHKVKMTATSGQGSYMFILSHGELLVRNSNATTAEIQLTGTTGTDMSTQIFTVFGSYRSTRWNEAGSALETDSTKIINTRDNGWFSHLELGQNVKVIAGSGCMGTGIAVDVLFPTENAYVKLNRTINYRSDIYAGNFGLAQGVKVDVYGDIEIAGKGVQGEANKAYCVKVNGYVYSPKTDKAINTATFFATNSYATNFDVVGRPAHQGDTIDAPFIHVHSTANLVSDNKSTRSTAVYSSGYSRMLIEGYCEGSVGVYANSGKVEINDAEVVSTSTDYTTPTANGGAQGGGSAVVINTRDNYTGEIEVTISGDSKVTATTGYAVEEIVTTTADTTKVQNFTIEGGTIEGGNKGAIIVSNKTATDANAEVVVYGGNISGNTKVGAEGDITDILPTNGTDTTAHVTVVTDPVSGKTTIVVSEGAPVPASEKDKAVIAGDENTTVNWKHLDASTDAMNQTLIADMTLKELEMNQNYNQTLTLGNPSSATPSEQKVTLTVGHMVLGYNAKIIVNPGSKLIITGEQGIVAPTEENLIIMASETAPATFLFHPAVTSNRQPGATVQLYTSEAKQLGAATYKYQRITTPLSSLTSVTNNATEIPVTVHPASPYSYFGTWIYYWNYSNSTWTPIAAYSDLQAFNGYQLTNNSVEGGVTYNFKGNLQGNVTSNLDFQTAGFNIFANSYTAPIHIKTLLNNIGTGNIDKSIHLWNAALQRYESTSVYYITNGFDNVHVEIPAMHNFVLNLTSGSWASVDINYNKSVWEWGTKTGDFAAAPQRMAQNDITAVQITVVADNGDQDYVMLVEDANLTEDYESGIDIEKYMNEGMMNLYATGEQNLAALGTNNLLGTMLSLQTTDAVAYTLEFSNVRGEELAIKDNVTNTITLMREGATYSFVAENNATLEGRFQIVGRHEMPTAVETIEETAASKAIYTVMGQYVGETTDWNNLPAGVYVVDGVKIVK